MRPLILVDVDGVLNPDFRCHPPYCHCHPSASGWYRRKVHPGGVQYRVYVNPDHGRWLRTLAKDTGAELAWATTWNDDANTWIGPMVGLPVLPVAPVASSADKAGTVVPWTAGRPFVWFDDDPGVGIRCAGTRWITPPDCLVVQVDPLAGLTEDNITEARDWLNGRSGT